MNNKNEGKNITLSEQFLILIQKSWKEREIGMSTTFIHDSSFFGLGSDISIKSGGVKLVL